MTQTDIVPVLKGFKLEDGGADGLVVKNPPTVRISNDEKITEEELKALAEQ